jgi:hypothetical protein
VFSAVGLLEAELEEPADEVMIIVPVAEPAITLAGIL